MNYNVLANALAHHEATFSVKENEIIFGITPDQKELANPVELLLGAFAACCLKNIERFSSYFS